MIVLCISKCSSYIFSSALSSTIGAVPFASLLCGGPQCLAGELAGWVGGSLPAWCEFQAGSARPAVQTGGRWFLEEEGVWLLQLVAQQQSTQQPQAPSGCDLSSRISSLPQLLEGSSPVNKCGVSFHYRW